MQTHPRILLKEALEVVNNHLSEGWGDKGRIVHLLSFTNPALAINQPSNGRAWRHLKVEIEVVGQWLGGKLNDSEGPALRRSIQGAGLRAAQSKAPGSEYTNLLPGYLPAYLPPSLHQCTYLPRLVPTSRASVPTRCTYLPRRRAYLILLALGSA